MQSLLNFIFPPRCQLCSDTHQISHQCELCESCCNDIYINQQPCERCAEPLAFSESGLCAECLQKLPVYDICWSPFVYAQPLEWMIQQLKFNSKLHFAPLLSTLMIRDIGGFLQNTPLPDVIIPMPLHVRRLRQRGFNQSYMLVKPIAKELNLKIDIDSCQRVRNTEHQTGKNALQRRKNIKGAFTFNNEKAYKHVVIFDDVVTTGSSVIELSKVLKKSGVKRVDVWCLARAKK